jgi:Animal haem peroxidase
VQRHGSESYFVIGEGLLTESVEGRATALAPDVEESVPPFRFSRMGPVGAGIQLGEANRRKLGLAMTAGVSGGSGVPAGYTYLGQFIDHDLTFDKTQVMLGPHISPAHLLEARSPALDLDSLYGAGPQDPESAKFYSDGVHLKVGDTTATNDPAIPGFDLPRASVGSTAKARRKAVIPDPRNDENLAVAQTHLAFIRFHNRVVDSLPAGLTDAQKFAQARELVVKHYQWMIRTDFLPRLCAAAVVNDVFTNGRKAFEVGASPMSMPTMPIEFSVAAYRLGHSMARAAYNWNKNFDDGDGTLELLFEFSGLSGTLGGGEKLPSNWIADFRRLYDFKPIRPDLVVPPAKFNRARRIDTRLANPLRHLPQLTIGPPPVAESDPTRNLAYRNLTRARMVRLATGQQMAKFLKGKGVTLTQLTKAQIRDGNGGAALDTLTPTQRDSVLTHTPLWFYILREAEVTNGKLQGVGARIVAETFQRAMEGSQFSIVRDAAFRPSLGPNNTTFRMIDLLLFAANNNADEINPLGD